MTGRLARTGSAAWQLLGIGLLGVAGWWLARQVMPVLVPLVVALLLATLLRPVALALQRRHLPPAAAALAAVALFVVCTAGAAAMILPPFVSRLQELGANVRSGAERVVYAVGHDVAGVSHGEAARLVDRMANALDQHRGQVAGDVLTGVSAVVQGTGAAILALFLAFFVVKDAARIGAWLLGFVPRQRRAEVRDIGASCWQTLGTYIRGVIFVATVDAVFIGLALLLVGVPLAMPLIVLTWVGAFFPIIGAFVAGVVAVLVALVADGLTAALVVLAAIVVVQQVEGNVLYPLLVGPRLRLHPMAVLLSVTAGGVVAGIAGAFLAVPVAAVVAVVLEHRREARPAGPSVELPGPVDGGGARALAGQRGG